MKTIKSFVLAAVLLIAGGAMLFFTPGGKISTIKAQGGPQPYHSTWQASYLYRVRVRTPNGSTTNGPAFGVAEWTVGGDVNNGSITYNETWEGPPESGFSARPGGFNERPCLVNYDSAKWLAGCYPNTSAISSNQNIPPPNVTLERVKLFNSDGTPGFVVDNNCPRDVNADGTAASCSYSQSSNAYKSGIWSTGTYGFASLGRMIDHQTNTDVYATDRSYMVMPLQWTVSGTITYH